MRRLRQLLKYQENWASYCYCYINLYQPKRIARVNCILVTPKVLWALCFIILYGGTHSVNWLWLIMKVGYEGLIKDNRHGSCHGYFDSILCVAISKRMRIWYLASITWVFLLHVVKAIVPNILLFAHALYLPRLIVFNTYSNKINLVSVWVTVCLFDACSCRLQNVECSSATAENTKLRSRVARLEEEKANTTKLVAMLEFNNEHNKNKVPPFTLIWSNLSQNRFNNLPLTFMQSNIFTLVAPSKDMILLGIRFDTLSLNFMHN